MASLYHRHRSGNRTDPFIDLLFNTLLGFSFLFLVSLMFINPDADQAKVDKQAEYMVTVSWDDTIADDIDLWAHAPTGHTVSYLQKEAGWLHLDRDDRGIVNDTIEINGEKVVHPVNEEILTIRNRQVGEYIVNLYYYKAESPAPIKVNVKVDRINPKFETVYRDQVELKAQDEELTIVRFRINDDGSLSDFNQLPLKLTPYGLEHIPEDVWKQ
jgi:hypothetical protein